MIFDGGWKGRVSLRKPLQPGRVNQAVTPLFRTLHRSDRRSSMAGIFGLIAFINVSRNPRFALIHTVDVVQLIACGMCFGVALARLIAARRAAGQWPDQGSRRLPANYEVTGAAGSI